MCVLGGGGGVHGTKVSKKTPQNNLLKINIHRIVYIVTLNSTYTSIAMLLNAGVNVFVLEKHSEK